jgi:hypothetical protein
MSRRAARDAALRGCARRAPVAESPARNSSACRGYPLARAASHRRAYRDPHLRCADGGQVASCHGVGRQREPVCQPPGRAVWIGTARSVTKPPLATGYPRREPVALSRRTAQVAAAPRTRAAPIRARPRIPLSHRRAARGRQAARGRACVQRAKRTAGSAALAAHFSAAAVEGSRCANRRRRRDARLERGGEQIRALIPLRTPESMGRHRAIG